MEVWFRDKCVMEEGYRGEIWECLGGWHMKKVTSAYGVSL